MADGEKKFGNAGQIKSGSFILIDGAPCQVKDVSKSKPGKHGSAKVRAVAVGLFDGVKRNLLKPGSESVEIPIIERGTAQVVADLGTSLQIMDTASYATFDIPKPKDITGLKSGNEVEYLRWGEQLRITRQKSL